MVELADTYISVRAKMPGVQKDIASALGSVDADAGGRQIGEKTKGGLLKGFAVGGAVAGVVGVVTAAVAGSIGGLVAEAVAASDATDKFKKTLDFSGIDSGEIDRLTDKAQAYADKTVYGLGDIQNITAQLAANGVKDFDKLAEASGNLNAVAGGNAETFKSVGMVLTQTAGQGKLTTENWNQLADAIPGASGQIQKALEENGAFVGNFRDAMTKGEITAEEFNTALLELGSQPVAVEAATSTATLEGALGNLQATIVGGLADAITFIKPVLTDLIGGFSDLIGGVFEFIGAIGSGGFDFAQFAELASYLSPIGLIFKVLQPILPVIAEAFGQIAQVLGGAIMTILPVLLPVLTQIVGLFAGLAAQIIPMLLPIIVQLVGVFAQILEAIAPIIAALVGALVPILEALIPVVLMIIEAFLPLITALIDAFLPVIMAIVDALMALLVPILEIVVAVIKVLAEVIKWLVTEIVVPFFKNILIPVIQEAAGWFVTAFGGLADFFTGLWEGIVEGFKGFINFIIDGINGFLSGFNELSTVVKIASGGTIDFGGIPELPRLAQGGIVRGSAAGTAVRVGEAGHGRDEAVLPLPEDWQTNGLGGKGVTQYITTVQTDPTLQARAWAREAGRAFASS